ncbi:hypothetical protein VPH35_073438 [Triticum aestivum]
MSRREKGRTRGGQRKRDGSGDRVRPPRPHGRGLATAASARSFATTTSRRWRPSCGGPSGRASGTTSSCSARSSAPTSALTAGASTSTTEPASPPVLDRRALPCQGRWHTCLSCPASVK